jgi:aminoglycoside phosphotransferase (APT) family kinase protein
MPQCRARHYSPAMLNPGEMGPRVAALLEANGARDVEVSGYEPMTGGYSRLMARFEASFVLNDTHERATFVLRGDPPRGQAIIETDRRAEFEVIRSIQAHVNTPAARFLDEAGEHVGTPALVLEFSPGASTSPWIEANGMAELPLRLAELAASVHTVPVDHLPAALRRPADGTAAMTEQIDRWRQSAENHVEALPIFRYVAAWLDAHRPPPVPLGLVHHDFSTANMLVGDDGRLVAIDFELASIGDPREDLGYFKAYAQAVPPDVIDADADGFYTRYRELTGYSEEQINPAVATYFLVLGVIGVVDQLRASGATMARGEGGNANIAFNFDNLLFGQAAWVGATKVLEAALDGEV